MWRRFGHRLAQRENFTLQDWDVVSTEPIQSDSPLLAAPNCIITPHISWAPKECRQRIMDMTADNIQHFISSAPIHVVNR